MMNIKRRNTVGTYQPISYYLPVKKIVYLLIRNDELTLPVSLNN